MNDFFSITLDRSSSLSLHVDSWIIVPLVLIVILIILLPLFRIGKSLELDQTEFGIGDQKITLKPNLTDKAIAYKIWVELSTRKIGLPIDLDDDVIVEIYDSWYSFFAITRELIKDMPAQKIRRKDTEKIINLSIDVLNEGLRPHLTKWQARFRRWYEKQIENDEHVDLHPQDIQMKFPDYEELKKDMLVVNKRLIEYRKSMIKLTKL